MSADVRLLVVEVACRAGRAVPRAPGGAAQATLLVALTRLLQGLRDPSLASLAAPPVPGATLPLGARVPGTSLELEPAGAAAILGALLCGAAPGPVDHLAPLLAAADYAARHAHYDGVAPPRVADLLEALEDAAALCAALGAEAGPGAAAAGDAWFAPRVAGAIVVAQLLGADEAGRRTAALGAALDGSPPSAATLAAVHGAGAAFEWQLRRAAGENAARAVRHALAARHAPVDGAGFAVVDPRGAPGGPGPFTLQPPLVAPPAILEDFAAAVQASYPERQAQAILATFTDGASAGLPIDAWVARLVRN